MRLSSENKYMVLQGHVENGVIIPDEGISLPDGTEVVITLRDNQTKHSDAMSEMERKHYLAALDRIDAVANENPGDSFSGVDHDRVLYGT